ncbi:SMI1/KNR4 family protein [Mucilaginibacter sp. KACC 22773]|uniref:SMI1/KNR4 family protein n=1 Tax=Mucilaginibacter sp. KACC 22773 TaxID=3025671 RepID=UPI002365D252|nr:SMI1/KNR4 family protein [Mucilaginibacter sp. KACC 22773]WDF75888.1 SMI1/KNR4 family protein [Mucilaginibacter sp. KACC 22773]
MDIKYLTLLNNNRSVTNQGSGFVKTLGPITEAEILSLEAKYNNGHTFPAALRELLSLAGNYCYVLDYGLNDTQEELQQYARRNLTVFGRTFSIERPFYVIDVYGGSDQFVFVYLDQGQDPMTYQAVLYKQPASEGFWIRELDINLSKYIESGIKKILSGINPF